MTISPTLPIGSKPIDPTRRTVHSRGIQWRSAVSMRLASLALTGVAMAESRITYKSAKTGTSYYQMGIEIAQAMKNGSNGAMIVTVEESQGSVQNVMEAARRGSDTGGSNFVFTTPPALVGAAQQASGPFKDKVSPEMAAKFASIRALFPLPSLTMHFVMRAGLGGTDLDALAGRTILLGKGSFGATEGEKYLKTFGLFDKVKLANAELSNAVAALKNGQIDGFVTAGSWPAPNVLEAAAGTGITLLSMSDAQIEASQRTRLVIPAGTYAGQERDVNTTSLPVVAYTTADMADDTAYALVKTFWAERERMAGSAPWWRGVNLDMLANIQGQIHSGALRFYREAGASLSDRHQ